MKNKQRTSIGHLLLTKLQIEGRKGRALARFFSDDDVPRVPCPLDSAQTCRIAVGAACQIETRIIAAGGMTLLRQYGKLIDAEAIKQNLALVTQLNKRDPKLATYLGVQASCQQQLELEQAQCKLLEQAVLAATAKLKERNDAATSNRYQHQLTDTSPITGEYYI